MKPITGAWFEFYHHNPAEGKYYNPALRAFSADQWRAMIGDAKAIGMDTLVLTCSSLVYPDHSESYGPVDVFPQAKMACENPLDVLMQKAEEEGMRVFLSAGFYGMWYDSEGNMQSREVEKRAFRACETMYARYKDFASFAGWYLPDETEAGPLFSPVFLDYVKRYTAFFRALDGKKVILAAPYGTNKIDPGDDFVRQLEQLDLDYMAYQDEVGVQKSTPDETGAFYEGLRRAHDKAGRSRLWADMEVFSFEGQVYHSALIPADMERVRRQMESISPHVEKVLCYAYPGLFSRPGSTAACGYEGGDRLYTDYQTLLRQMNG